RLYGTVVHARSLAGFPENALLPGRDRLPGTRATFRSHHGTGGSPQMMLRALLLSLLALCATALAAQDDSPRDSVQTGGRERVMDHRFPQEYEIGGITVTGTLTTDPNAVKLFTGLQVGDKIQVPGEAISRAIRNL